MSNKKNTQNIRKRQIQRQKRQLGTETTTSGQFKYKIGFNQSVSSGVIGLDGYVHFDSLETAEHDLLGLASAMRTFEGILQSSGYLIASIDAPKNKNNTKLVEDK